MTGRLLNSAYDAVRGILAIVAGAGILIASLTSDRPNRFVVLAGSISLLAGIGLVRRAVQDARKGSTTNSEEARSRQS